MIKAILTYFTCLVGLCAAPPETPVDMQAVPLELNMSGVSVDSMLSNDTHLFDQKNQVGNYLAGQFAQRHHDWKTSSKFIDNVLETDSDNLQLLSRAMILAMGSGQYDEAITYAKKVKALAGDNTLAALFLAAEAFKNKDYAAAASLVENMPEGGLSEFMMPLLRSWSQAGIGQYETTDLYNNTIHIYHAILIAEFMDQEKDIEALLNRSLGAQGLTLEDVERLADIYAHIGKTDMASELYAKILEEWPESPDTVKKINALKDGQPVDSFETVSTPEEGLAEALYEMALLLYREYSDDSARVFANMALYLEPELTESTMLLAHLHARNERTPEAIAYYNAIPPGNARYLEAQRLAANLMEDAERDNDAISILESLYSEYQDPDSLIQIGDIYRRNEEFDKAIKSYNKAEKALGDITKEYWHLLYVRGMSYEQNDEWLKAEQDLKAALVFQPDHPLVLNYLGYAWADQGVNLKESLELIRKAAAQEQSDGYIIDSLGWVLYRIGEYHQAVPKLERAVELLPYDPVINDHLGDAYWRVGRKMEARFQWQRARNHAEDQELLDSISQKLVSGLEPAGALNIDIVKEASTHTSEPDTTKH